MPTPIDDDDDDLDTTPKGIARRVKRVADIVERANKRLEKIRAGFADPPDPDKPAILAALNEVVSQSTKTTTIATELTKRVR